MAFNVKRGGLINPGTEALAIPAKADLKKCDANKYIFKEAGFWPLFLACRKHRGCRQGDAIITEGFKLSFKYLIHSVCLNEDGSYLNSEEVVRNCYKSILDVAIKSGISSIAIPILPSKGATSGKVVHDAYTAISDRTESSDIDITLYVDYNMPIYDPEDAFPELKEYVSINLKSGATSGPTIKFSKKKTDIEYSLSNQPETHYSRKESTDQVREEVRYSIKETTPDIREIDRRIKEPRESFSDHLLKLADERNLSNVDVYTKANISKQQFSRIISNVNYSPQKKTIFAFAVALELTKAETEELLKKAGHAFSDTDKFDVIISYFLEKQKYDIFEINEALFYYRQPLLGSGM